MIVIKRSNGRLPQNLEFPLDSDNRARLLSYITSQDFHRIEIIDPAAVPLDFARDLASLDIPLDFFIADGGLYLPTCDSIGRARTPLRHPA